MMRANFNLLLIYSLNFVRVCGLGRAAEPGGERTPTKSGLVGGVAGRDHLTTGLTGDPPLLIIVLARAR